MPKYKSPSKRVTINPFLIRSLAPQDADDCFEVWQLSQKTQDYGVSFLENLLQQQANCVHFGAFIESRKSSIGWVTLGWIGNYGKLVNLFVNPQFRADGIGGHLVRQVICSAFDKNLAHVDLEVATANNVARKLYEQSGFRQIGSNLHRQQYRYSRPE